MGKAVLAYQFVSGLLPEIQVKVAGIEGSCDQLWIKACFEEAKLRDLSSRDSNSKSIQLKPDNNHYRCYSHSETLSRKCYVCAKVGHLAKDCPQQRRGKPAESRGHQQKSQQQSGTTSGNGANHHVTSELSEVKGNDCYKVKYGTSLSVRPRVVVCEQRLLVSFQLLSKVWQLKLVIII